MNIDYKYGKTKLIELNLLNKLRNNIIINKKNKKIICINSELFIQNLIYALKYKIIDQLKNYYSSVNFFLINDIQNFPEKKKYQKEFFHKFYNLLNRKQKIISTCNFYSKKIIGIEDFLKSIFEISLIIVINPIELNERMSLLIEKAYEKNILLPIDIAFYLAKKLKLNIQELENILNKIIIQSNLNNKKITINFVQKILKKLFFIKNKLTIDIIQKIVSDYYKIKINDLLSKKRLKSIVYSRQIAMAITKKLTNYSLSEIGNAFGGRDHTTVLHACKKIKILINQNNNINNDFFNLIKKLST